MKNKSMDLLFERKFPCKVIMGRGILADVKNNLLPYLPEAKVVILTNPKLNRLYGKNLIADLINQGINVHTVVIPDSEKTKDLATTKRVCDKLLAWQTNRFTTLITLGGGVIGDLGGFIAAIFMRGIPLIHIPTTLLAQIDSSIGGKVAINHEKAKNIIGNFYHPKVVLVDSELLLSLPLPQIKNGLVEAIKIAIISNHSFFNWLEDNIEKILQKDQVTMDTLVEQAVQAKINIVLSDPWENNKRQYLNLGHTIGHVWETMGNYTRITHGEAVALGLLMETKIAYNMGICSEDCQKRINDILSALFNTCSSKPWSSLLLKKMLNVNLKIDTNIDFKKFWNILTLDKKNKQKGVVCVLPEKLGKVRLWEPMDKKLVKKALEDFFNHYRSL